MLIVRCAINNRITYGVVEDERVFTLKEDPFSKIQRTGDSYQLSEVVLLAPCQPSKIICVGLNYVDHAAELNLALPEEPILFLKPPSTLVGPYTPVIYPNISKQVDYEAELAIVIREKARNVSIENAYQKVLGYTCGNDVTARDLQRKDGQWTRAKSFDTFCPLGPWIRDDLDPNNLNIKLWVNEELKQNSNTCQMIFPVDYLVSYVSRIMTLFPGDVIMTGTPVGVGQVKPGDVMTVEIEKLGSLINQVKIEEILKMR